MHGGVDSYRRHNFRSHGAPSQSNAHGHPTVDRGARASPAIPSLTAHDDEARVDRDSAASRPSPRERDGGRPDDRGGDGAWFASKNFDLVRRRGRGLGHDFVLRGRDHGHGRGHRGRDLDHDLVRPWTATSSTGILSNLNTQPASSFPPSFWGQPLLDLGPLEECVLLRRPSARNRSPFVGDVRVVAGPAAGTVAICHLPNMDSGGKCRPGVTLLCRRQPGVTPDTLGGKFNKPKCELVCQLLRCEEQGGVWVSAHPTLGERLVEALLRRGALDARLAAPVASSPPAAAADAGADAVATQVTVPRRVSASRSGGFRPDFRVTHADGTATVLEAKQVVDTDYDAATAPAAAALQPGCPLYAAAASPSSSSAELYRRAGIFPWGKRGQKGPDGESVVSARAIAHLRELSAIAGSRGRERAAVVFLAGRGDVESIRPNAAACPSLARHLTAAAAAGVAVLGHRVRWGEGRDAGRAWDGGPLPVVLDGDPYETVLVKKARAKKGDALEAQGKSTKFKAATPRKQKTRKADIESADKVELSGRPSRKRRVRS